MALKTMVPMPRPHFITTCNPDWEALNCEQNGGNNNFKLDLCLNSHNISMHKKIYDSMKSFPSGHAQLSCFAAVVAMAYIYQRVGTTYSTLWRYWLQFVCFLSAAFISSSRLQDHRHHVHDVVAGAALGSLLAFLAAKNVITSKQGVVTTNSSSVAAKKEKRPSQMRLIHPEYSYG